MTQLPYDPSKYAHLKEGQDVDVPLSHLSLYAGIRDIDMAHVSALMKSVSSPADLRS